MMLGRVLVPLLLLAAFAIGSDAARPRGQDLRLTVQPSFAARCPALARLRTNTDALNHCLVVYPQFLYDNRVALSVGTNTFAGVQFLFSEVQTCLGVGMAQDHGHCEDGL